MIASPSCATNGLAGHWSFEETLSITAADSSGCNNHGTIAGSVQQQTSDGEGLPGVIGNSLGFWGDSRVEIPLEGMLAQQGTVALFANVKDFTGESYFFGHTTFPEWNNRIQLFTDDGEGNLDLGLGDAHWRHQGILDLNTDQWYHIALTWDGETYRVYVDGAQFAAGSYSGLDELDASAHIGNSGLENPSRGLEGCIDEVQVFDRPLSGSEVHALSEAREAEPFCSAGISDGP